MATAMAMAVQGQQLDDDNWTTMIFTVVAMVIVALDRIVAVDVQASLPSLQGDCYPCRDGVSAAVKLA
jgi:hypothetical protein